MTPKDNIFPVILNYRLPIERNKQSIKDFLDSYFDEYISALEKAVNDSSGMFLRSECYSLVRDSIPKIRELCCDIIGVLELYDGANISLLHENFEKMMSKIENLLYVEEVGNFWNSTIQRLYRIRPGNSQFERIDLFHIPMAKRQFIKSYRYSIPGYPCIYLSTGLELCWFECGMPKKFNYSEFKLEIAEGETIKLISFNRHPLDLVTSIVNWYQNHPADKEKIDNYLLKYLVTHPLRAACSIEVADRNNPFIEEYILPQLLLLWVRKNTNFDGIAYSSCSSIEKAQEWNYCNVVFPAKELENGYCKRLTKLLLMTEPVIVEMCKLFEDKAYEIEKVRSFTKRMENRYYNGKALYLYREILSLCKTFLLLHDCLLTDKYDNAEAIYQAIDTLNLLAYMITENTENFKQRAIALAKDLFYEVENVEIEREFLEVVTEFSDDVKPVLFDLWGYAKKLSYGVKAGPHSFERVM